jgi:hypothetical protein
VGWQNVTRARIGDADAVLDLLWLLFETVQAAARPHQDVVLENLLLRHQLVVLNRPTRSRPQARLRLWDKLLWILARRFCAGWREHLAFLIPVFSDDENYRNVVEAHVAEHQPAPATTSTTRRQRTIPPPTAMISPTGVVGPSAGSCSVSGTSR